MVFSGFNLFFFIQRLFVCEFFFYFCRNFKTSRRVVFVGRQREIFLTFKNNTRYEKKTIHFVCFASGDSGGFKSRQSPIGHHGDVGLDFESRAWRRHKLVRRCDHDVGSNPTHVKRIKYYAYTKHVPFRHHQRLLHSYRDVSHQQSIQLH